MHDPRPGSVHPAEQPNLGAILHLSFELPKIGRVNSNIDDKGLGIRGGGPPDNLVVAQGVVLDDPGRIAGNTGIYPACRRGGQSARLGKSVME
jgi:hypothetical protein